MKGAHISMDQAPSISGAASHTARPPVHFFFFLLGLLPGPRVNRQDKPDPVAWSMPDGFTLGAEPSKLDASLVGKQIYSSTCARAASAAHGHFPDRSGGGWAGPRVT